MLVVVDPTTYAPAPSTRHRRVRHVEAMLAGNPSLEQLQHHYPEEWELAQRELSRLLAHGGVGALKSFLATADARTRRPLDHREPEQVRTSRAIRRHMTLELVRRACVAKGADVPHGRIRLGRVNGTLMQWLFFEVGLRRKPVSLTAYRLLWPRLTQQRRLMPLVMQQGIYCFYSRRLVKALARLIAGRPCLEIAAGDGTLSRFLTAEGVAVTATDNFSWDHAIRFDEDDVERLEARQALRTHTPQVVLCSWPPPGNTFEKHVFTTPSVDLYVLITSRNAFAAGNTAAYSTQTDFDMIEDPALSRLVLPNGTASVYLFHRRTIGLGRGPTTNRA